MLHSTGCVCNRAHATCIQGRVVGVLPAHMFATREVVPLQSETFNCMQTTQPTIAVPPKAKSCHAEQLQMCTRYRKRVLLHSCTALQSLCKRTKTTSHMPCSSCNVHVPMLEQPHTTLGQGYKSNNTWWQAIREPPRFNKLGQECDAGNLKAHGGMSQARPPSSIQTPQQIANNMCVLYSVINEHHTATRTPAPHSHKRGSTLCQTVCQHNCTFQACHSSCSPTPAWYTSMVNRLGVHWPCSAKTYNFSVAACSRQRVPTCTMYCNKWQPINHLSHPMGGHPQCTGHSLLVISIAGPLLRLLTVSIFCCCCSSRRRCCCIRCKLHCAC